MQKVLTNKPDPARAADAQKFLALTALSENPKDVMAAEAGIQKELPVKSQICAGTHGPSYA